MAGYAREHPGWTAVYVEFWTHASRRPELRRRVAEQHERLLDAVGGLVEEWTARWAVEFTLPAREVVRGIYARDRWSRDRLLAFQGERLWALIAHAVAASPYYRDLLGPDAASGDVPLAELPTLPKATLMESSTRSSPTPAASGGAGGAPGRAGRRAAVPRAVPGFHHRRHHRGARPVRRGRRRVRGVDRHCLRGLASWGLGPATRLAGIGAPSPLHISNQVYAVPPAGQPSAAPRLAVTTPLPEMVAALNAFQPRP